MMLLGWPWAEQVAAVVIGWGLVILVLVILLIVWLVRRV